MRSRGNGRAGDGRLADPDAEGQLGGSETPKADPSLLASIPGLPGKAMLLDLTGRNTA